MKLTSSTVCVSSILIAEIKKIIKESEIMKYVLSINTILPAPISDNCYREDDTKWPQKNKDGRQELEIRLGNEHISFEVCHISATPYDLIILTTYRLPKSALSSTSMSQKIPRA